MQKSEQIGQLASALAAAQTEIKPAEKDSANPFFHSKYSSLSSVWNACKAALAKNGLSVSQMLERNATAVTVTTLLMHKSGEWLSSETALTPKDNSPQAFGSAWTYGRRYALAAMVGVAPDDDDGEAAQPRPQTQQPARAQQPPKPQAQATSSTVRHG